MPVAPASAALCAPAAGSAATVFRDAAANPWLAAALLGAAAHVGPLSPLPVGREPGLFAFADPARPERVLTAAGFSQVDAHPVDASLCAPDDPDGVADWLIEVGLADAVSVSAVVHAAAGGEAAAELCAAVYAACGGNPLYLAELLRAAEFSGRPLAALKPAELLAGVLCLALPQDVLNRPDIKDIVERIGDKTPPPFPGRTGHVSFSCCPEVDVGVDRITKDEDSARRRFPGSGHRTRRGVRYPLH